MTGEPVAPKEVTETMSEDLSLEDHIYVIIDDHDICELDLLRLERDALKEENEQLRLEVVTDPLTNLYNGKGYHQQSQLLEGVIGRTNYDIADSHKEGIGVFFIDVKKFKQVNDTYGHAEGDRALVYVAGILKEMFPRQNTVLARTMGDEFEIAAPGVDSEAARALKTRIREYLIEHPFSLETGESLPIELSIGFDYHMPGEGSIKAARDKADTDMYDHKKLQHALDRS